MLRLYRRHLATCAHKSATYRRCPCPVWVDGSIEGRRIRKSLDTTSWKRGEEIVRELEPGATLETITFALAFDRYVEDAKRRKLGAETLAKYALIGRELAPLWGTWNIKAILPDDVARYSETWTLGPLTAKKKLERLRAFFSFCFVRGWLRVNPMLAIKSPTVKQKPTLPFSDEQVDRLLWATEVYPSKGIYRANSGARVKAFVLLLLHSGLRIQDAVTLPSDRVKDGRLLLYTQKTGTPVHLPLPPEVIESLEKMGGMAAYPFWSGQGDPKSAVKDWQRSLRRLFKLAAVKGHAHMFRDTFAVRLLVKGVPLQEVSILLGHSSVRVTEKHYSPWIKARQDRLESLVRATWA